MTGQCKLCDEEKQLCESHIVPKFIYRWVKSTSPTSFMRKLSNPNIRIQDGHKYHLLCKDCEDKFSKYEKIFAENHFHPSINEVRTNIDYKEEIFYFVCSILWRFIIVNIDRYKDSPYLENLNSCQSQLKEFLTTFKYPYDFDRFYAMFIGYVYDAPEHLKGINQFATRTIDCQIIYDEECCFFYLHFPYFIFIGDIYGLKESDFDNSKIHPSGGNFNTYLMKSLSQPVGSFIENRIIKIDAMELSEKQRNIVEADFIKNIDKINEKKGFEPLIMDHLRDYHEN